MHTNTAHGSLPIRLATPWCSVLELPGVKFFSFAIDGTLSLVTAVS